MNPWKLKRPLANPLLQIFLKLFFNNKIIDNWDMDFRAWGERLVGKMEDI